MRYRRKLLLLYIAFCLGLFVIWARAAQMQVLDGTTWEREASKLRQRSVGLDALRGSIIDAEGVALAEDVPVFQLVLVAWDWQRRARNRCTACGIVHFPGRRLKMPRRCECAVAAARASPRHDPDAFPRAGGVIAPPSFESLPPGDLKPLEEGLGLEMGELAKRAAARVADIKLMVKAAVKKLREDGTDEFLVEDKEELLRDDLLQRPYLLESNVPLEVVRMVELDEAGLYHGFRIRTALRRRYPLGDFAPQLMGYVSLLREGEQKALEETHPNLITTDTRLGRRGLERAFNWHLHGEPGYQRLALDRQGRFSRVVDEKLPSAGNDLRLSLSARVSREAETILESWANKNAGFLPTGKPSGAFVAIEADTGRILLWAEMPRFDLNAGLGDVFDPAHSEARVVKGEHLWMPRGDLPANMTLAAWRDALVVPVPVSWSRVAQVAVEPGSTFKPLIALGLLNSGKPLAWEWFTCGGRQGKPHCHNHAQVDLIQAIATSCNRYFAFSLRDSSNWTTYRTSVAALIDAVGIGHAPDAEVKEWSAGTWLRNWVDFALADAVAAARERLDVTLGARAPEIVLARQPRTPPGVGGDPKRLAAMLASAVGHVARASACPRVVVNVARASLDGRQIVLRFGVRAAARSRWYALSGLGDALTNLPARLRRLAARGKAGLKGDPARGGTLWFEAEFDRKVGRTDLAETPSIRPEDGRNVAIGQGPVLVTPLQMARAMAVIANGGRLVTPHVVSAVGGGRQPHPPRDLGLAQGHIEMVRKGMYMVANSSIGTARRTVWGRVGATVYGKTGTAQVGGPWKPWESPEPGGPWHHWFVGFAEAPGRPTVAFACVLHSRTEKAAGLTSAHAVQEILARWFPK